MKKLTLIIRDYAYLSWLRANHNHDEAIQKGKELAIVLLLLFWSMPVLAMFATLANRFGYGPYAHQLKLYTQQNPILKILLGALMFAPFYWLARWQVNSLNDIPVAPVMPFRKLRLISWLGLLLSFSLIVIIPLTIQALFFR